MIHLYLDPSRGALVTMALAGNAFGNIILPHFVFPQKKYLPHFICGGPGGSMGTANSSGWMQEQDFVVFLQHFVQHTWAIEENKILLLLVNHSSHVSIEAINFSQANGVVMLSFPPHCTHQLQPLDKSEYGPLKKNTSTVKWTSGTRRIQEKHSPSMTCNNYSTTSC